MAALDVPGVEVRTPELTSPGGVICKAPALDVRCPALNPYVSCDKADWNCTLHSKTMNHQTSIQCECPDTYI
jgi:hypothetical protein